MAFIKLPVDAFDTFTVMARPVRTFTSSSTVGVDGTIRVYKRLSEIEKDSSVFNDTAFSENSPEGLLKEVKEHAGDSNFRIFLENYMEAVNNAAVDPKFDKSVEVIRFEPSFKFTSDTLRKNVIRSSLMPHYRISQPGIGWGYTNYNCIHFPNDIGPTSASIIYPNPLENDIPVYSPTQDFTLEFYVKPSYTDTTYNAGTIMHMSSCLAVSIVSGSKKNYKGEVDSFRLLLQLSHSADVNPRNINVSNLGSSPLNLAFISDDLKIFKNHWHHVAVQWSPTHNDSTGSFIIDGKSAGIFSCSLDLLPFSASNNDRSTIIIGNYYDGPNTSINGLHGFFSETAIIDEGVTDAFNAPDDLEAPDAFSMRNPFKGELHEIRLWKTRRDSDSLASGSINGVELESDLLFYLPPFFRKETKARKVLQTPFQADTLETDDPFNVALSFGVGGHHINLENHLREMVKGYYPRLLFLTSSEADYDSSTFMEANAYLYATGSTVRRNLTILPCDNGKFYPNFSLLYSGTDSDYSYGGAMEKFVTDMGTPDLSFVNLSHLVATSSLFPGLIQESDILGDIAGASPENPGVSPGSVLTIFQRTRDDSSNAVTFFDASNLFYGTRILPESYELIDPSLTGSNGTMQVKLKDNGRGFLYRADAETEHATWSSVGFVLYPEGLSVVTTPYFGELFGKDKFTVNLRGMQPVNVLEIPAIAPAWQLNTSSNPDWKPLYLTDYANEEQAGFIRISRVNFHDENLNIVARTDLAQPINKRTSDRIMVRTKIDF